LGKGARCLARVRDAQHEGIADGLHASGAGRQLGFDRLAEVRHEGCRLLVPVRLRQGGEAGDIREDESGLEAVKAVRS
jgi:hypothetical protein